MPWKTTVIDVLRDGLRFCAGACILIDGILLSVFSVWFVARFLWHLVAWLNRTLFLEPW